jgi:hypothetical protein
MALYNPKERSMIQDKLEDITIQYVYIKSWKYVEPLLNEKFYGHPTPGRVYRAGYNNVTKSYRFYLDSSEALYVHQLINKNEEEGYVCECVTLMKENLLTLNILEEDLDKIISWIESNNQDILKPQPESFPMFLLQALNNAENERYNEEAERMAWITEALTDLDAVNSIQVEVILELIDYLYQQNLMRHDDINNIALDESHGLGTNISRAQDKLNRYAGSDRRTNQDKEDLLSAISHLIVEAERRNIHQLDEE